MPTIGIVGGMGPMAGLRLARLIVEHTLVERDQDHPNLILTSEPAGISDRSEFLAGRVEGNPARGIVTSLSKLAAAGVSIAGIACNTAHADAIFREVRSLLERQQVQIELLHMVDLAVSEILRQYGRGSRIGVLGTLGVMRADVYGGRLRQCDMQPIVFTRSTDLSSIHEVIYCPRRGIKANSGRISSWAIKTIDEAIHRLRDMGADAIVLACTELPLVVERSTCDNRHVFDPSLILARALLERVAPGRWID